jgi:hypothetical protein
MPPLVEERDDRQPSDDDDLVTQRRVIAATRTTAVETFNAECWSALVNLAQGFVETPELVDALLKVSLPGSATGEPAGRSQGRRTK